MEKSSKTEYMEFAGIDLPKKAENYFYTAGTDGEEGTWRLSIIRYSLIMIKTCWQRENSIIRITNLEIGNYIRGNRIFIMIMAR